MLSVAVCGKLNGTFGCAARRIARSAPLPSVSLRIDPQTTQVRHRSSGIVGLPNVGKSTLFNALTRTQLAEAANYPFCTIEPNSAKVSIPDARLDALAAVAKAKKTIYSQLEFTDIAGLVKGAHKGEGLGNKFLQNIREVSLILHVVRCYENTDIIHVHETVDPVRDIDVIETELMLADMQAIEKRLAPVQKKAKTGDKESDKLAKLMEQCIGFLDKGDMISTVLARPSSPFSTDQVATIQSLQLLTSKPVVYVCNVDESAASEGNAFSKAVQELAKSRQREALVACASLEEEASKFQNDADQLEFLNMAGLEQTGLQQMIAVAARILGLQRFYTIGVQEARSWLIPKGISAAEAAGKIHTDMQRGFIRAEVIKPDEFLKLGGEDAVKAAGKMTQEGKEYVVQDGDIMHFRFNV